MKPFEYGMIHNYGALLFDLDGTLVDSMPAHNQAWIQVLKKYGVDISEDILYKMAGIPNFRTAEIFIADYSIDVQPEQIVEQKEDLFVKSFKDLQKIPAVAALAEKFYKILPLGIVSGSSRARIIESLEITNLTHLFNCIVSSDDTERGKPFPEPYELAARLLGVDSKTCLVFEDGAAGIEAALSAKMNVVYVKDGYLYDWSKK